MGLFYCEKYRVILPTRDIQDGGEAGREAVEQYEHTLKQLIREMVMEMRREEAENKKNFSEQLNIWKNQLRENGVKSNDDSDMESV